MDVVKQQQHSPLGGGGGGGVWWRWRATPALHVSCARKNQHGSTRKQANKQWERLRRGESRTQGRQWTERAREAMGISPPVNLQLHSFSADQALGLVTSAQANYMTVIVQQCATLSSSSSAGAGGDQQAAEAASNGAAAALEEHATPTAVGSRGESSRIGTKLLCVVRAVLKKIKRRVMVGDSVLVSGIDWLDKRGMIDEVLQRTSETADPPVANVDMLLLLFALDRPRLDPVILNRFLVEAESTGIPLVVVLNKADLVSEEVKESWDRKLTEWGYKPYICSVESGTGLAQLAPILENRTSIVFGPSGTGKSSLIKALRHIEQDGLARQQDESDEEDIRVSEVSRRSGLGRHTTRHVSLLQLPLKGALLADSPGFSYPSLTMVSKSKLSLFFPEVRSRLEQSDEACTFLDCQHISEPGCVVGSDWERYAYYVSLWNEVKQREEHEKSVFGTKQQEEFRFKTRALGAREAEPLLVMKKHRRISRKHTKQVLDEDVKEEQEDAKREEDEAILPSE